MSRTAQPPRMVAAPMPPDAPYFIPPSNITATRGRPRIHPDPPKKPLAEMTPEERRQYDAAKARKHLAKKAAPKPQYPRVFVATQEEAEAIAGPGAVAVKKVKVSLPVEQLARVDNAVAFLKDKVVGIDHTEILSQAVRLMVDALEKRYNDGKPFPPAKLEAR